MALETSGFQLSQFESAPQIPGNIGVVDTKSIYGAVVDALKTNEALRTTQAAQAATDAELALAQQKAQTEMGLLGPEAEARRAKAELLAAEAPYQQGLLRPKALATRTQLEAETIRNRILAEPATARQVIEGKTLTPAVRTQVQLQALLNRGGLNEEEAAAIKAKLGQALSPAEQAKLQANLNKVHEKVVDGQIIQFTNSGAVRIPGQTDWMFGTVVPTAGGMGVAPTVGLGAAVPTGAPLAAGVPTQARAPLAGMAPGTAAATFAQGLGAAAAAPRGMLGGESAAARREAMARTRMTEDQAKSFYRTNEKVLENLQQNLFEALPRDQQNINSLATKTDLVESAIDAAIKKVEENSRAVTGGGKAGEIYREWIRPEVAASFDSDLGQIRANIGFDTLQTMRENSKTGGALGNVSDNEGKRLESVFGELSTKLSPQDMIAKLQQVKEARRTLMNAAQQAYETKKNFTRSNISRISTMLHGELGPAILLGEMPGAAEEAAAPTAAMPALRSEDIFAAPSAMAPARLTIGAAPAAALSPEEQPAPGPHTEGPLVPVESKYEAVTPGTPSVPSYPGRVVTPPAPAQQPAAPAPAAPTPTQPTAQYPAYSALGVAERLAAESRRKQEEIRRNDELIKAALGNVPENLLRAGEGAIGGLLTGEYRMPEKSGLRRVGESIGEALAGTVGEERELMRREDEILRTRPNSWDAYDIRRKRGLPGPAQRRVETPAPAPAPVVPAEPEPVREEAAAPAPIRLTPEQIAELSQIKLSPESTRTARRLLSEYQAGQKAGRREQPVLEITASDGKRRSFTVENPDIADQLIAILTGQQAPNLEPRLETDREATRQLTEGRMRREELARQLRAMPRR